MTQPETRIDEVIDGIYRIASWSPDYGITFNQFLPQDQAALIEIEADAVVPR